MANLKPPVNENDHHTGNDKAKITLVEYGDYQCSHCAHAHPLLKELLEEKGDYFKFVFRNFPLKEAHPLAMLSALAAEAAGKQHKFWEMHDMLYENQAQLNRDSFIKFAESLDLDLEKFAADLQSEAVSSKVENDFESGIRSGVNGTPSFFINDQKLNIYDGTYESLKSAVTDYVQE